MVGDVCFSPRSGLHNEAHDAVVGTRRGNEDHDTPIDHMEYTIRPVEEDDAEAIIALLNPIIEAGTWTIMQEVITIQEQRSFIRGFPARGIFHAAVSKREGRVLGIQDLMPRANDATTFHHIGEISTFVAIDSHRRGIGHALMLSTLEATAGRGFMKVSATIRADNPGAVAYYTSEGFRVIGRAEMHAFVGGRFIDEILAERLLPG